MVYSGQGGRDVVLPNSGNYTVRDRWYVSDFAEFVVPDCGTSIFFEIFNTYILCIIYFVYLFIFFSLW